MEPFFAYLIKNLVDQPEAVEIHCRQQEETLVVEVRVASEDVGKVIGRQGKIIASLRTLACSLGARFGCRLQLEIVQ